MTLITVLIVLAVELYLNWGERYRNLSWFEQYYNQVTEFLQDKLSHDSWLHVFTVVLLPVVILSILLNLFSGGTYYFVLFLASCFVLFISLGPKSLASSFDPYFAAMERNDQEAAFLIIEQESLLNDLPESEELVRNATRTILVESQTRYFGVIFWFIFAGPFGALFYRIAHTYFDISIKNEEDSAAHIAKLIHWLDWAPTRLTSIIFLFTGDFVKGFYRVRDYFVDFSADNRQLISETGVAALGLEMGRCDGDVQENKDAYAMVERTLLIYLVAVAALSPLAFW